MMKKLNFLVSLTNDDNDYQQEQAAAAEKAARRLGVDLKIIHANNDAVTQSQQLLHYIQGAAATRPDAIVFEPAGGTGFPQVARAATAADIGWVILNHEADYVHQLRQTCQVPVFSISSDHGEVGEIQGKQFAALLPQGGSILYIEGPANSSAAQRANRRHEPDQAREYSSEDDASELDGTERTPGSHFVVAIAHVTRDAYRSGGSAR